jgi:hypothetical protein
VNLVIGSGSSVRDALEDPELDEGAVYSHGRRLEASLRFFGASKSVNGADEPRPRDPRRPRHPIVVRAEMRVLLDTLKHELELDLPEGREKPIDAIWTGFAVEESFFRVDDAPFTPTAPFSRSAKRAILADLIAAHEITDPEERTAAERAALERIPPGWTFVPLAWTAVTDFAFLEFYLVYAFNDYKEYGTWPFDNEHEGDVEGFCVVFRRSALDELAGGKPAAEILPHTLITSAHEEFNNADDLKRLPETNEDIRNELRVYVAAGSHASYLYADLHDILDFEDIATDLPDLLPGGFLAVLAFPSPLISAILLAGLVEHLVDSEDKTSDDGVSIGPGQPDVPNLKFDKTIEVTPLSAFDGKEGENIYQRDSRALLALRGYPGKWGGDDGFINKSAPWKNKTDRYFRQFLARGQIAESIL